MESKIKNLIFCALIIIAVVTFTGISYKADVYGQSVTPMNNTMQQHANHTFDNLIKRVVIKNFDTLRLGP